MKIHNQTGYSIPKSNTYVYINKIKYETKEYYKVSYMMIYKTSGEVIDIVLNGKIYKDKITHWSRLPKNQGIL